MSSATETCNVCGVSSKQRCSRCRKVWYCSAAHQQSDWKKHKSSCTTPNEVKGIYFKAGETEPRLITVPLESKFAGDILSDDPHEVKVPILSPLLGPGFKSNYTYSALNIMTMGKTGPELEHPFKLFIRDNFMNDGSPPNKIPSLLTNGKAPHPWAGSLLALKETAPMSDEWMDCTMQDLPTLVKYFEWYGTKVSDAEMRAHLRELFGDKADEIKVVGL